jgi:3-hydroxyacyl-[acyl-carrier-protein] dehydratase
MRWIWLDRFTAFESGKSAEAVKNLSHAEDVFAEHFPGWPVMPVALMLEGLAQTGGILVGEANNFKEKVVLAKIGRAKFSREALAGESLRYAVEVLNLRPEGAIVQGRVFVGDEQIGEAEVTFAHLDQSRSSAMFGERNFVFDSELKFILEQARSLSQASKTGAS